MRKKQPPPYGTKLKTAEHAAMSMFAMTTMVATGALENDWPKIIAGSRGILRSGQELVKNFPHPKIILERFRHNDPTTSGAAIEAEPPAILLPDITAPEQPVTVAYAPQDRHTPSS